MLGRHFNIVADGPTLVAQGEAREQGYDQVLWLLGPEGSVTEAGASNFFVVWRTKEGGKLQMVTAPLGDKIILDGVTRRSLLEMTKERLSEEVEVVERKFTMSEIKEAIKEGRMVEAFVSGTAVSGFLFLTSQNFALFRLVDRTVAISGL